MSVSNPKYEKMVKELSLLTFEPKREECKNHRYEEYQFVCNNNKCKSYLSLFCGSCGHTHSHLLQFKRATTVLKSFLQEKWAKIQENNYNLGSIYTACGTNIRYCKDILNQIQEEVERCKQKISSLPLFEQLLTAVLDAHQNPKDNQRLAETFAKLDADYQLFQKFSDKDNKKQNVATPLVDKEIQSRQIKWVKVGEDIKKFTEKMLAFIEKLRLQFKISKEEIEKNRQVSQAMSKKLANLWEILQQMNNKKSDKIEEEIQQIPSLVIQLPEEKPSKSSKEVMIQQQSCQLISESLQKFRNLKSIVIKNKNGRINHKMWDNLTAKFEYLKFLKELWLNIRAEDMRWLTKLFKERAHAVRSISILHLTITDEPKLDMKQVAQFCNTLELRELHLVLTRDNITKSSFIDFTKTLRFRTSLSSLPMEVLEINLTKNKIIQQVDVNECTNMFYHQYQAIKSKKISF